MVKRTAFLCSSTVLDIVRCLSGLCRFWTYFLYPYQNNFSSNECTKFRPRINFLFYRLFILNMAPSVAFYWNRKKYMDVSAICWRICVLRCGAIFRNSFGTANQQSGCSRHLATPLVLGLSTTIFASILEKIECFDKFLIPSSEFFQIYIL